MKNSFISLLFGVVFSFLPFWEWGNLLTHITGIFSTALIFLIVLTAIDEKEEKNDEQRI